MRIGFVGLGKLGLPVALAVEQCGHEVVGYDIDAAVTDIVLSRRIPYHEAGAQQLLEGSNLKMGSMREVVKHSEIVFVAVQTPHEPMYEGITRLPATRADFDYSYLKNAVEELSRHVEDMGQHRVVVVISTVLPGTIEREIKPLLNEHVKLCYNPFFIAMGTAIDDFLNPEFVLFGVDDREAAQKARRFYETATTAPFYETTVKNAELIKVVYNTFIGMKIDFVNVVTEICHRIDANVDAVTDALKLANKRLISPAYLTGGMGDGGGCHPRDQIALSWLSRELGLRYDWFENMMLCREAQADWLADIIQERLRSHPGHKLVILGKAFKPNIGLVVGSHSILLASILVERGVPIAHFYDPYLDESRPDLSEGRHVVFVGTKHDEFSKYVFSPGTVVLDPFGFIKDQDGVIVVRLGRQGAKTVSDRKQVCGPTRGQVR